MLWSGLVFGLASGRKELLEGAAQRNKQAAVRSSLFVLTELLIDDTLFSGSLMQRQTRAAAQEASQPGKRARLFTASRQPAAACQGAAAKREKLLRPSALRPLLQPLSKSEKHGELTQASARCPWGAAKPATSGRARWRGGAHGCGGDERSSSSSGSSF